jgi:ribosomal protein L37AE/L43A
MINVYKCNLCGKIVKRESEKKWMKSYCDEKGDTARIYRIDPYKLHKEIASRKLRN